MAIGTQVEAAGAPIPPPPACHYSNTWDGEGKVDGKRLALVIDGWSLIGWSDRRRWSKLPTSWKLSIVKAK